MSQASSEHDVHLPDGRVVSIKRVASHLKRKGVELPQALLLSSSTSSPPSHSPTHSSQANNGSHPSPLSLVVDPPDVYKLVARLFADTRLYNQEVTAAGESPPPNLMLSADQNWFQSSVAISATRHLLELDSCIPALGLLRALPLQLNQVLRNDSPRALGQVFTVIGRLMAPSASPITTDVTTKQVGNVIRALVRYLAAAKNEDNAAVSPGSPSTENPPHPVFRRILTLLASLSRLDDESLYEAATRAMDQMASFYSPMVMHLQPSPESRFKWGLWSDFVETQFPLSAWALKAMRQLQEERAAKYGEDSWEATQPLFWVGFYQLWGAQVTEGNELPPTPGNMKPEELEAIWEQVLRVGGVTDTSRPLASTPGSGFALRKSAHLLAVAHHARGEAAQAEKLMRTAMGLLIRCDGQEANLAVLLRLCTTLQKWFVEWGDSAKAEEMRGCQAAVLRRIEIDTWTTSEEAPLVSSEVSTEQQGQLLDLLRLSPKPWKASLVGS